MDDKASTPPRTPAAARPAADRPVGPPVAVAAKPPGPVSLGGRDADIVKLDPAHGEALWQATKDDDSVWDYMGYGPFASAGAFQAWVGERVALTDPYSYAVIDKVSGMATGIVTLMEIRPAMGVIEIGNIVYSPALQRTRAATEVQYLVARHIFEDLGYRRYEWKCNALNMPSRRAAARLGFTFEGIFRQHMVVKGRNRDTAWFSMLDTEWPQRKDAFERWLDPANFDDQGRQYLTLSRLNDAG